MILSGERRYRAAKQAGLPTIDCIIVEGDLTEADRLEEQLTENVLRQDLNPIERAIGIRALMKIQKWTQKRLAEHLQIEASDVTRSLALLELPDKIQKLVEDGTLAPRTAYEITKLQESDDELAVANIVVNQELDTRATEKLVRLKRGQASTDKESPILQKKGKIPSENQALLETKGQSEPAIGSFPFLLHQHNHPSGHITSILKADREDVALTEQIKTLQAHILILKRASNEKKGV
jgi:ParB-like chromosome segregation protein Spo0J